MTLKMTVLTMSALTGLLTAVQVNAEETLVLSHSLTSYSRDNGKTELFFTITAKNGSNNTLNDIVIVPTGNEFIGNPEKIHIKLPALAAGDAVAVNWQVSSYMEPHYFLQPSMLFFTVSAHRPTLTDVAFSVTSESQ